MPLTNLYSIGTLMMPSTWIALIIAFVVAYGAVRIRFGKQLAAVLADAIFYFIIVWKLSVILTDFNSVINSPLSLVYFHGGLVGFYLGLFAAGVRIVIEIKKHTLTAIEIAALFTGAVLIQAIFQVMMVFLNEGGLVAQIATVTIFTLFALFVWLMIGKSTVWPLQLVLLFIAIHLFTAAFQEEGLTGTPVIATVCMGLFFGTLLFKKRETEFESEGQL